MLRRFDNLAAHFAQTVAARWINSSYIFLYTWLEMSHFGYAVLENDQYTL